MSDNKQKQSPTSGKDNAISEEAIARRAYEKWQSRGCPLGQDQDDWFAACSELERERSAAPKSLGGQRH